MKLETKLGIERILLDVLFGGIVILGSILVELVATGVIELYRSYGLWVIFLPLGAVLFWALGHVVHGMTNTADIGERTSCDECHYRFRNVFTEWWHKRSCLPWLTKNV